MEKSSEQNQESGVGLQPAKAAKQKSTPHTGGGFSFWEILPLRRFYTEAEGAPIFALRSVCVWPFRPELWSRVS